MPSLADSLAQLSHQSDQITALASHNVRPAGQFVQALLRTPNVLHLIRDADDSEVRLFKFVGEEGGGVKRVEKRDGGVVTPLRDLKKKAGGNEGRDRIEAMLKTALKLVDDYRPMPRARAHVANLLETYRRQTERIAELEGLINEFNAPSAAQPVASSSKHSPTAKTGKPFTPDEAIRAEEESLRKLELSIARAKRTVQSSSSPVVASPSSQSPRSPVINHSPPSSAPPPLASQTPAKTPRSVPHISNSLVNGTTPRRVVNATVSRFSPLKLSGTPRASVGGSGLRNSQSDEEQRSIFGRVGRHSSASRRSIQPTTPKAEDVQDAEEEDGDGQEFGGGDNETVRLAAPIPPAVTSPASKSTDAAAEDSIAGQDESEVGDSTAILIETGPTKVDGVNIDSPDVEVAVAKIWGTTPEMMRQGVKEGTSVKQDAEGTVKHIYYLSQSDPAPPPSPSTASSLSSLSSGNPSVPKSPPITSQTILLANLLLILLRSEDGGVAVSNVKENLATMARARGWEGGEEMGTKVLYLAVGRRIVRIDRRGGGGGKVSFAA